MVSEIKGKKEPACRNAKRRGATDGCFFKRYDGTSAASDDGLAFAWTCTEYRRQYLQYCEGNCQGVRAYYYFGRAGRP